MPELPEVEVVRAGLLPRLLHHRLEDIQVLDARSLRRQPGGAETFIPLLRGGTVTNISRRGKYLWWTITPSGGEPFALVAHLGMSGQLLVKSADYLLPELLAGPNAQLNPQIKHLKLWFRLRPPATPAGNAGVAASDIWFVDQRIFGGMFTAELIPTADAHPAGQAAIAEALIPQPLAHIARDPLDQHCDWGRLYRKLRAKKTGLKRALLDQSLISGIGNIYADEALFAAGLHYQRRTQGITRQEMLRLQQGLEEVLARSLAAGGTSFDALYVDVEGNPGYFARALNVYGREGQPCYRCQEAGYQSLIVRESWMNRSTYYCPRCQPRPRRRHH